MSRTNYPSSPPSDDDRKQDDLRRAVNALEAKRVEDKLLKERAPEYERQANLQGIDDPELCKQIAIETSQRLAKAWTTPGVVHHLQERTAFDEAFGRALDGTLLSKEQAQSAQPKGPANVPAEPKTQPTSPSAYNLSADYVLNADEIFASRNNPTLRQHFQRQDDQRRDQADRTAWSVPATPATLAAKANAPSSPTEADPLANFVTMPVKTKIETEFAKQEHSLTRPIGRSR